MGCRLQSRYFAQLPASVIHQSQMPGPLVLYTGQPGQHRRAGQVSQAVQQAGRGHKQKQGSTEGQGRCHRQCSKQGQGTKQRQGSREGQGRCHRQDRTCTQRSNHMQGNKQGQGNKSGWGSSQVHGSKERQGRCQRQCSQQRQGHKKAQGSRQGQGSNQGQGTRQDQGAAAAAAAVSLARPHQRCGASGVSWPDPCSAAGSPPPLWTSPTAQVICLLICPHLVFCCKASSCK